MRAIGQVRYGEGLTGAVGPQSTCGYSEREKQCGGEGKRPCDCRPGEAGREPGRRRADERKMGMGIDGTRANGNADASGAGHQYAPFGRNITWAVRHMICRSCMSDQFST